MEHLASPGVASYYLTTPIYYVNDAPHVGHAYTTLIADAVTRWHRLAGDDVFFLTGTDEHGLKVAQAAEANGVTPKEWADRTVARYQAAWDVLDISYDRFIRTTEPGHYAAVTKLLQACYDAGDIELDTYRGWYSVSDEEYIGADEVEDYRARGRKVIELEEENYFFRLSRFQDRLLQWYEDHPDVIHPVGRRNEVLGLIKGGLLDFSISRTSLEWGVPIPWDERHVTYVWFDALTNYITAAGYGQPDEAAEFREVVARGPPHRQGHHPLPLRLLAGDAAVGRRRAAAGLARPRLAPRGRREDEQDRAEPDRAGRPRGRLRPRPLPLSLPGRLPGGGRQRLQLRGDGRPLQRRPGQQPGQPAQPRRHGGRQQVRRLRTGTVGQQPAARGRRHRCRGRVRGLVRGAAERGARRDLAAHPGDERLPGGQRAMEGRARARPSSRCWATRSRRCASSTLLASPAIPGTAQTIWERIGLPGALADQRVPDALAWGGYPGGLPVTKGAPLFPRRTA